jgi:hypothetical protein
MKNVCSNSESLAFPPDMKNIKTEIFPSNSSLHFLLLWYIWFAPKREFRNLSRLYNSAVLCLHIPTILLTFMPLFHLITNRLGLQEGRYVRNLLAVVFWPATHPVGSVERNDFQIFWPRKNHLATKRLVTDADVKQAVTPCLQKLHTDFFYGGIKASVPRWEKWLNINGDYLESDVYHLLSM